jgi:hypothetical protein
VGLCFGIDPQLEDRDQLTDPLFVDDFASLRNPVEEPLGSL